jgi:hypothetical protein
MEVTDLGPTQLKNIDRQIRACSVQVGVPAKPKPTKGRSQQPRPTIANYLKNAGYASM